MSDIASLVRAAERGDVKSVVDMVGANPKLAGAVDDGGATALHHAAFAGLYDVIDALLAAGADVNARDGTHGATPGGWALHRLRERGALLAIEIDDVHFALDRGDDDWVQRLVSRHPALRTAQDRTGRALADHPHIAATAMLSALFRR